MISLFNFIINGVSGLVECCQVVVDLLVGTSHILLLGLGLLPSLVPFFTYLFMLNHHSNPLFEVFLHADSAALKKVLYPFNFCLEVFEFVVLSLILLLSF